MKRGIWDKRMKSKTGKIATNSEIKKSRNCCKTDREKRVLCIRSNLATSGVISNSILLLFFNLSVVVSVHIALVVCHIQFKIQKINRIYINRTIFTTFRIHYNPIYLLIQFVCKTHTIHTKS